VCVRHTESLGWFRSWEKVGAGAGAAKNKGDLVESLTSSLKARKGGGPKNWRNQQLGRSVLLYGWRHRREGGAPGDQMAS